MDVFFALSLSAVGVYRYLSTYAERDSFVESDETYRLGLDVSNASLDFRVLFDKVEELKSARIDDAARFAAAEALVDETEAAIKRNDLDSMRSRLVALTKGEYRPAGATVPSAGEPDVVEAGLLVQDAAIGIQKELAALGTGFWHAGVVDTEFVGKKLGLESSGDGYWGRLKEDKHLAQEPLDLAALPTRTGGHSADSTTTTVELDTSSVEATLTSSAPTTAPTPALLVCRLPRRIVSATTITAATVTAAPAPAPRQRASSLPIFLGSASKMSAAAAAIIQPPPATKLSVTRARPMQQPNAVSKLAAPNSAGVPRFVASGSAAAGAALARAVSGSLGQPTKPVRALASFVGGEKGGKGLELELVGLVSELETKEGQKVELGAPLGAQDDLAGDLVKLTMIPHVDLRPRLASAPVGFAPFVLAASRIETGSTERASRIARRNVSGASITSLPPVKVTARDGPFVSRLPVLSAVKKTATLAALAPSVRPEQPKAVSKLAAPKPVPASKKTLSAAPRTIPRSLDKPTKPVMAVARVVGGKKENQKENQKEEKKEPKKGEKMAVVAAPASLKPQPLATRTVSKSVVAARATATLGSVVSEMERKRALEKAEKKAKAAAEEKARKERIAGRQARMGKA